MQQKPIPTPAGPAPNPRATQIRTADLDESETRLCVTWEDGHQSVYPLRFLREQCPCATCRTLREEKARQTAAPADPFQMLDPRKAGLSAVMVGVEPVGSYAMRILWEDGHSTGIYTFEYLRELCPCSACQPAEVAP